MIISLVTFRLPKQAMVAEKYGAQPEILYLRVPVTVDNLKHLVEAE